MGETRRTFILSGEKLLNTVMYSSSVSSDDVSVTVNMQKDGDNDGKN